MVGRLLAQPSGQLVVGLALRVALRVALRGFHHGQLVANNASSRRRERRHGKRKACNLHEPYEYLEPKWLRC